MTKDELGGAVAFKVRRIFSDWWLLLFDNKGKSTCRYGPLAFSEVQAHVDEVKALGLIDMERDLGSRGK